MGLTSLTITLPDDMAQALKDRVASGEYASESEAICDGLRQLDILDLDDTTLLAAVKPAYDAYLADPGRALPAEEVFDGMAARYRARKRHQSSK